MTDWERESAKLFRAAREELSPSASDRELVRARLAKLGVGAAIAVGTMASATRVSGALVGAESGEGGLGPHGEQEAAGGAALAKTKAALIAKVMGVAAVAGAIGVLAISLMGSRAAEIDPPAPATPTSQASPPSIETAPLVEATSPDETTVSPSLSAAPPSRVKRSPVAGPVRRVAGRATDDAPSPGVASGGGAAEEASLVAEIDAALRADDPARASRLADEHERRFPRGLLVDEREAARVLVRCASAPDPSAADAFLRAHPRSPLYARVAAACGASEKPSVNPRP